MDMTEGNSRSLAFVVASWTAAALVAAMTLYAAVEYVAFGPVDLRSLAVRHLWHVVLLTSSVYLVLALVLRVVIVRPMRRIGSHLYRIGAGHVEPIAMTTRVAEIEQLVTGVNRMVTRMELSHWKADGKSNSLFPYELSAELTAEAEVSAESSAATGSPSAPP